MKMLLFSQSQFQTVEAVDAWLAAQLGPKREALGPLAVPGLYGIAASQPDWMVRIMADILAGTAPDRRHISTLKATELEQGVVAYG